MLDVREVAANFPEVERRLAARNTPLEWARFHELFAQRKLLYTELEADQATRNKAATAMRDPALRAAQADEMRGLGRTVKVREAQLREIENELTTVMLGVPNVPHPSVPSGPDASHNVIVRTWGAPPTFTFKPLAHDVLGEQMGYFDFERASKVSGPRFAYSLGPLAKLERALASFMVDAHVARGYLEVLPPYLVSRDAMIGTGQLPKFESDAFKSAGDRELFLIPTAEVPLTNYHAGEILEAPLPRRYVAHSPCFRAEAGAAGRDTHGLFRMHQFHKVELMTFAAPDAAADELERLTKDAASILEALGLHYRVVELCTGDLGFASQKTYDLEVWLPSQGEFREISSCSWFGDFQARRAKIRFREAAGDKPRLVHTLNGSGLAIGRCVVAILENFQQEDGSVTIPPALVRYFGASEVRRPW